MLHVSDRARVLGVMGYFRKVGQTAAVSDEPIDAGSWLNHVIIDVAKFFVTQRGDIVNKCGQSAQGAVSSSRFSAKVCMSAGIGATRSSRSSVIGWAKRMRQA